ncbi:MAG: hypothetical protein H5T69_12650 [Chloroflexi bacterium]|nr:hypothetical protein [Chloroflexota bacterium]
MKGWWQQLRRAARGEEGFTFLESILSTAIAALVLGAVVVTIFQFNMLTRRQSAALSVNQQMSNLAVMLNHDVVSAKEAAVGSGGQELTLQLVSYAFNQVGEPVTTTITYEYVSTEQALMRTVGSGAPQTVARHIQDLRFGLNPVSGTVQVTVTAQIREESLPMVLTFERRPAE